MEKVSCISIHSESRGNGVDFEAITGFVAGWMPGARVQLLPPLLDTAIEGVEGEARERLLDDLAGACAAAKVRDLLRPVEDGHPVLAGEVAYERRRLAVSGKSVFGLLYDAHMLGRVFRELIGREASTIDKVNIVFTNQLIGTWDDTDRRYHARTVVCGSPAMLSLSGMVAAPARSRDYYLARQGAAAIGLDGEEAQQVAGSFADDYLEYDDSRLTEVVKGYVMQAIVYRLTGEPFCGDPQCRLFNAHRQSELLEAQLGGNDFCERHSALFEAVKDDARWI